MNMDKTLHSTVFRFILALWRRENQREKKKAGKMQQAQSLGGFLASNNPNPPRVSAALAQMFYFLLPLLFPKNSGVWWIATLFSRPSRRKRTSSEIKY